LSVVTFSLGDLTRAEAFSIADGAIETLSTRVIVEYSDATTGERTKAYGSRFRDSAGRPWEHKGLAR
jgi:hypothetical protein